jgi:hypothetical protein
VSEVGLGPAVIVVDDNERFYLQVRRFLSRAPGWTPQRTTTDEPLRGSVGGSSRCHAQWVKANDAAADHLGLAIDALGAATPVLVLVDYRSRESYNPMKVVDRALSLRLAMENAKIDVWVVSAYHVDLEVQPERSVEVYRKGYELLLQVGKFVDDNCNMQCAGGVCPPSRNADHILVTGAGFEFREDQDAPGVPLTYDIMAAELVWPDWAAYRVRWIEVSENASLDEFWNQVLACVKPLSFNADGEKSVSVKDRAIAYERQRELRDRFRTAIARHDWGSMRQSVDAARLDWCLWLSTNYTRFADRAVFEVNDSRPWRRIAHSREADDVLARQSLELESLQRLWKDHRLLIKLHGDITHVETMALAGYDKERLSPLLFKTDGIHLMYRVAEALLSGALTGGSKEVHWHIVGHALQDKPLAGLIRSAFERRGERAHVFHVASTRADDVAHTLRGFLGCGQPDVRCHRMTAIAYMDLLTRAAAPAALAPDAPPPADPART